MTVIWVSAAMTLAAAACVWLAVRRRLQEHRLIMQVLRSDALVHDAEILRNSVYALNSTLRESVKTLDAITSSGPSSTIEGPIVRHVAHVRALRPTSEAQALRHLSPQIRDLRSLEILAERVDDLKDRDLKKAMEIRELVEEYMGGALVSLFPMDRDLGLPRHRDALVKWYPTSSSHAVALYISTNSKRHSSRLGLVSRRESTKDFEWVNDRPAWLEVES